MAKELATTSYEVYFLEKRGWDLYARFPEHERYLALKSAKVGEEQGKAAKIVREVYYPLRNESEESVAYISRNLKDATRGEVGGGFDPFSDESGSNSSRKGKVNGDSSDSQRADRGNDPSGADVAMHLLIIGVASMLVAGLATSIVSLLSSSALLLLVVFVGVFLVSAVPLFFVFGTDQKEGSWSERGERQTNNERTAPSARETKPDESDIKSSRTEETLLAETAQQETN